MSSAFWSFLGPFFPKFQHYIADLASRILMDAEMNLGGGTLLLMWTSCESSHKSAPWGPSHTAWSDFGALSFRTRVSRFELVSPCNPADNAWGGGAQELETANATSHRHPSNGWCAGECWFTLALILGPNSIFSGGPHFLGLKDFLKNVFRVLRNWSWNQFSIPFLWRCILLLKILYIKVNMVFVCVSHDVLCFNIMIESTIVKNWDDGGEDGSYSLFVNLFIHSSFPLVIGRSLWGQQGRAEEGACTGGDTDEKRSSGGGRQARKDRTGGGRAGRTGWRGAQRVHYALGYTLV
jgi:hypothetical protein